MTTVEGIRRTVRIKLDLSKDQIDCFRETIQQFQWAANHVVNAAWNDELDKPHTLCRKELHDKTYETVREATDLHATHVQLARNRAHEALSAVTERRKAGWSAGKPAFTATFLDYNERAATLANDHATLSSINGRLHCPFVLPQSRDTPHQQYLFNPDYDTGRSTLVPRNKDWYLHVNLEKTTQIEPMDADQPGILGIDLGLSNLAVSSTGRFWSGDRITHWRREYERRRQGLQQCGTRWAHQALQSVSQRFHGRVGQYLHIVSKELVQEAEDHDCPVIVFEDLTGIYKRVQWRSNMRSWAYRTLIEYVTYKSKPRGITVATVDPEHTSQRCSTCGYTDTANRTTQDRFECRSCGYENHADYNAAKNVGLTYLRHIQNGGDGGAPAGVRTNSGIVTGNGYQQVGADT